MPTSEAAAALAQGRCGDPFALLGLHAEDGRWVLRSFQPGAQRVYAQADDGGEIALRRCGDDGLFVARLARPCRYTLRIVWPQGEQHTADPYAFGPLLDAADLRAFADGLHPQLGRVLGAQAMRIDSVDGVRFAVWAPNARRVSVVGDFNGWDGRRHPMRLRVEAGVWELFVPGLAPGTVYKYEVLGPHGLLPLKADPVALRCEVPPRNASVVDDTPPFAWTDAAWMEQRARRQAVDAPLSIYELHASSWSRPDGRSLRWDELATRLLPHVRALGFTHIELLPVSAHPFGGSWGYQPLGLYAPHAPLGTPAELQAFVDACHAQQIGVIVDWVPAHFPSDAHGLAHFDGTALYEHADPREGFHQDWNTLIYNFGRREVCAYLIGSALHWLEQFHIDGLRVDAVASMLYRDYSRRDGEWVPNHLGGRENFEAIAFLRRFNEAVHAHYPGAITIAEESTAWPGVTRAVADGGLGFSYKWNMGWMNDTLRYMARDPIHRSYAHDDLSFGLVYAFSENFILPLSHDEVVHGKRSLIGRMPGDDWQRHANLRAYYAFMWAHPGKKLLFMGGELAQEREWNHDGEIEWEALRDGAAGVERHAGVLRLVGDLNRLLRSEPALHALDAQPEGFCWVVGDDRAQSVYAFLRHGGGTAPPLLVVCNFTPVARHDYRVGVSRAGTWTELLNSDAHDYGGSGVGNGGAVRTRPHASHGQPQSLQLTLPPLATLILRAPEGHDDD
ncbi:1,4-alpha-glucan branching protein GlgB [Sinimarinibacterium flocculans]|uniref:1,4-alpha-glucan branching protein GlgB n=1 Tax=Sinimarinibacterium flocculans TaxID=985250 RepID=UPI00249059F7|nr:1,4-alpha-glucan branching protein GlgB [Sinimarinibacterium flocculans]